jgi:hypothetical protein
MQQIYYVPKHICSVITVVSIVVIAGLTGCTTTSLQNLAVEGPLFQPPVHLTKDSTRTFQLHPWITMVTPNSKTGRISGHTDVNSDGIYYVDTNKTTTPYTFTEPNNVNDRTFTGTNFSWKHPSMQYGLDIDMHLFGNIGISTGGSYASLNATSYWQAYCMLSTFNHSNTETGVRFDLGVEWQNLTYTADFVYTSSGLFSTKDVTFNTIHNNETQINPFLAVTLNGTSPTAIVHLFLQAAVVRQALFYISDAPQSSSYLNDCHEIHYLYSLSPGLSIHLAENISTVIGVRFVWDASMDSPTTTTFQPLLQFDIGL